MPADSPLVANMAGPTMHLDLENESHLHFVAMEQKRHGLRTLAVVFLFVVVCLATAILLGLVWYWSHKQGSLSGETGPLALVLSSVVLIVISVVCGIVALVRHES